MPRVIWRSLVLTLSLLTVRDGNCQDRSATPAEQYQQLLKTYQDASSGGALSDAERMVFIGRVYKLRNELALKLVELAQAYPSEPIALDALMQAVWQVNTTPWPVAVVGKDEASATALALLERDHIGSDQLGPVCERISFGFCQEYESFLRKVLAKNPHRHVQAQACLALAHFLNNRRHRFDMASTQPELAREFADLFGTEYLEALRRQDSVNAMNAVEALFARAAKEYGELKTPGGSTVGEKAQVELFEIRYLTVGQEAPDIEGHDQSGMPFKLSDYRGKVVLLDFWHQF